MPGLVATVAGMHLFRRRWFLLLFLGESVNAIGSWTALIALWGFAAYRFDASPGQIALLGLSWAAPAALLGPFVGVPIDRLGPRRVLLAADVAGAAVGIAFMFAQSWGGLVVLGVASGVVKAWSLPAADALPPRLVPDEDLLAANAFLGAGSDAAIVFGPLLAALAVSLGGLRAPFAVDAATYLVGIAAVAPLKLRPLAGTSEGGATAAQGAGDGRRALVALGDGLRLTARSPVLRRTLVLCAAVYLTWGTYVVVEPIYVRDTLGATATFFAVLQAFFGIGLVGAGLLLPRIGDRASSWRALSAAVALSGVTATLYVATSLWPVAVVGVFLWGVDVAFFAAPSRTMLQRHSPPEAHGRVLALNRTLHSVADLVALGLAAALSGVLPTRGLAFAVAALAVITGAWGLLGTEPAGRRAPTGSPPDGVAEPAAA